MTNSESRITTKAWQYLDAVQVFEGTDLDPDATLTAILTGYDPNYLRLIARKKGTFGAYQSDGKWYFDRAEILKEMGR